MVFFTTRKTNDCFDDFNHRLPARALINKSDIAYVTTRANGSKDFVSVFTDDGTEYFSDHPLKNFFQFMPEIVQVSKSSLIPVNKISATNEWQYVYVQCGGKFVPFELMPDYRKELKIVLTSLCTLSKKQEKRIA